MANLFFQQLIAFCIFHDKRVPLLSFSLAYIGDNESDRYLRLSKTIQVYSMKDILQHPRNTSISLCNILIYPHVSPFPISPS